MQAAPMNATLTYVSGDVDASLFFDTLTMGTPDVIIRKQGFGIVQKTDDSTYPDIGSCDGLFVRPASLRIGIYICII